MTERGRIVLGEEDFAEHPHETLPPAGAFPPPASSTLPPVGSRNPLQVSPHGLSSFPSSNSTSGASWLTTPGRSLFVSCAIGIALAWIVTQALGVADITYTTKTGAYAVTGLWTGVVGVMFGGTLLAFDSAVAGAWELAAQRFLMAAVPMLGAAFAAGFLADLIYTEIVTHVVEDALRSGTFSANDARLYLARCLGWALFGLGIGLTIGLLRRSHELAINGALGGLLGGAGGGAIFQFVGVNLGAGTGLSRLIGLAAIGVLIAFATRAVETVRREAWLQVLAGGMAGKEFILYHRITRLGASPDCEIFIVKDREIAKLHAQIEDRGTERALTAVGEAAVFVNDSPVSGAPLRNGDRIQLGATVFGYSERGA